MLETPAHTARSFERMLRDNGFSRRDAKAITAKGFKAADFSESESTEIADMITELKQRQGLLRNTSRNNCDPNCKECEPCQKSRRGLPDCEELTFTIKGLNRRRWKAWRHVERATRVYERAVRKYAASQRREFRTDLLGTLVGVVTAGSGPMGLANALNSVFNLIHKYGNYNGELMRDFRVKLRNEIKDLEDAHTEAKNAEEDFQSVVSRMKRDGCSLHSSYFNRV